MIVIPDYRGHRIDVEAVPAGEPRVETVSCLELSAALAETAGEL
jgi:hypothetical protein